MSNVGGSRHYHGGELPGAGWACENCGALNVGPKAAGCQTCHGDPQWGVREQRRAQTTRPDPRQLAAQRLQELAPPPAPDEPAAEFDLTVQVTQAPNEVSVLITRDQGVPFPGRGATLLEAIVGAIQAYEEDAASLKCPTCGQTWPEHLEFPIASTSE